MTTAVNRTGSAKSLNRDAQRDNEELFMSILCRVAGKLRVASGTWTVRA
jgi:hypothetical protein